MMQMIKIKKIKQCDDCKIMYLKLHTRNMCKIVKATASDNGK